MPRDRLKRDVVAKRKVETTFTYHQHRKKHDQKQEKKKEIENVSQTRTDLTKLTQNKEIPIVVTTSINVDSFVKGYYEYIQKHLDTKNW